MDHLANSGAYPRIRRKWGDCEGIYRRNPLHDDMVKNVEDNTLALKNIRREFTKKNRMYRNLDGAWNTFMSDHQEDFEEYKALAPNMEGMEEESSLSLMQKQKLKLKLIGKDLKN